MHNTLDESPSARLPDNKALLLGLVKVIFQDEEQRSSNKRENDCPATVTPSPADVGVELICDLGSGKCGDNKRRGCEGVSQSSVLQLGQIGGHDIDTIFHAGEAHIVEDIASAVDGKAVARCHENQTDSGAGHHQGKSLGTAPSVHDLGHGNETGSRESIG